MQNFLFSKNSLIDNTYRVNYCLNKTEKYQTYRVINQERSQLQYLKIYLIEKPLFLDIIKSFKSPNLNKLVNYNTLIGESASLPYSCWEFIAGENLVSKVNREIILTHRESVDIILGILNGLKYLHSRGFVYANLKAENIMLVSRGQNIISKITDLEHISQSTDFQQDIMSVAKIFFYLVTGNEFENIKDFSLYSHIDKKTEHLILRGLSTPTFQPFNDVNEFIQAIYFEQENYKDYKNIKADQLASIKEKTSNKPTGFKAIAGMEELKETIQVDVIDAINQKEKYLQYGITIPNGMLLYGPPGCGKTFFAERMAEEIGAKFYQLKPSDIQSKWVNASQENVKELFNKAEKNAPSIIFIDELDAILPSRDMDNISHMNTSVVNEFLVQMNNCSEKGIFIIGATNRPNAIDHAILRSGRLDKHIYLPPPDIEARQKMFEIYLSNRPVTDNIDYLLLAEKTDNFVSSDIKFLCDEASRAALKQECKISEQIILDIIIRTQPSLSIDELQEYQNIYNQFSNKKTKAAKKNRIGF